MLTVCSVVPLQTRPARSYCYYDGSFVRFVWRQRWRNVKISWAVSPYFQSIVLFLAIETPYLLFAFIASRWVVWLPSAANEHYAALTRGLFNVVFIAWQALALVPIIGIVNYIYSSEWYFIYRKRGHLFVPGTSDLVSALNGGWLLRARYILSRGPSNVFRLSFLVALLCTMLAGVGPSSVAVLPWINEKNGRLTIATVPYLGDLQAGRLDTPSAIASANAAARWYMPGQVGFVQAQDGLRVNVLMPWPADVATQSLDSRVNITYGTDVIQFRYDCEWHVPVWSDANGANTTLLDVDAYWTVEAAPGHRWRPWLPSGLSPNITAGVFPLTEPISPTNADGLAAYLFVGNNMSVSQPEHVHLDLATVPSLYRPGGFRLAAALQNSSHHDDSDDADLSRLASIMLCDPSLLIRKANVVIGPNALISLSDVSEAGSSLGLYGNITPEGAAGVFSQLWAFAVQEPDPGYVPFAALVNYIAGGIFGLYPKSTHNGTLDKFFFRDTRINVLEADIAIAMTEHISTMAGAYMYGFTGPNLPNSTFSTWSLTSTEVQRFVVNSPFLVTTAILVGAIMTLLVLAVNLPSACNRQPLNARSLLELETLAEMLASNKRAEED